MSTDDPVFLTPPEPEPEPDAPDAPGTQVAPYVDSRPMTDPLQESRNEALAPIQLDTKTNLDRARTLIAVLEQGQEPVVDHTGCELLVPLSRERISGLNAALAARLRILNKTMPDLKQQDVIDAKQAARLSLNFNLGEENEE